MSFSKEERRLIHKKAQQPFTGNGVPSNLDGKENDIAYRRISNKGIVHYVKRDGEWQALSSTESLPAERSVTKTTTTTSGGTSSSVTDHGSMSGLTHDDHAQYLLIDGTRAMTGGLSISGDAALNFTAAGENSIRIPDNQASALIIEETGNAYLTFNTANSGGEKITLGKKLEAGSVEIEGSAFDINGGDISAATISGGLTWSSAQNLNSQNLTNVNIDSGDISAATISGGLTWSAAQNLSSQNLTNVNIDSGTVDGITSLTVAENVDIGNYKITSKALEASDLTSGRVTFAGANGLLSDDDDFTFATDTLTVTKIGAFEAAGSIDFSDENMTNVNIDSGAIDAVTLGTNSAVTEAQIDNININGYRISGVEIELNINQGGPDDAGDNRLRFMDNTTVFGDIEYNDGDTFKLVTASNTALQLTANGTAELAGTTVTLDSGGDIVLDAAGDDIYFKDGGSERFRMDLDGTPTLAVTGAFDIDCSADITLDAAGDDIKFQSAATHELKFTNSSGSWLAAPQTSNSSLTLSPNGTGDVICKLGNDVATSTFVVENSSATDRFVVDGLGTTKVISSSTTANAVDIAATALTTGKALYINHDDSHTEDLTVVSFHLDFDKSGVMDDGETGTYTGFDIDMNDTATNHAASFVNMKGIDMDVVSANAQGGLTNLGASFVVTGADTNNGIEITTTDGGTDLKIMSSADSGDYFSIATTTHGATTFTTVDDNAAAANLSLSVDGDIVLGAVGEQISMSDNSTTRFVFNVDSTPEIDVTGAFTLDCSDDIEFNADGGNFVFSDGSQQSLNLFVDTGGNVGDAVFKDAGNAEIFRIDGSEDSLRVKNHAQALTNPYSLYILPTSGCHYTSGVDDYQQNFRCVGFHALEPGTNVDNNSWY